MYVPKHFRAPTEDAIREILAATDFATLVSVRAGIPVASHLPVLYDAAGGEWGSFRAHLARANPHGRDLEGGVETLMICQGPHGYVSPGWYHERSVPTWDYIAVHAYCEPAIMCSREQLSRLLDELMHRHESRTGKGMRYADYPLDYVAKQIEAIVGVELEIRRVEASFKLSQNRSAADRASVCRELSKDKNPEHARLAAAIERFVPRD